MVVLLTPIVFYGGWNPRVNVWVILSDLHLDSPETNSDFAPARLRHPKRKQVKVFQTSIFRCFGC